MKPVYILIVLDGWGIGKQDESNAIYVAQPKSFRFLEEHFPHGALQASGISVGLPWEEEGNSEVGHLTIGAGKVLYQHFPRITMTVQDGTFFENPILKRAFAHARDRSSTLHLVGLFSDGIVHSALSHLVHLVAMAHQEKCERIVLHLFTDGRDSGLKSTPITLRKFRDEVGDTSWFSIGSLMGRYWAMDRDSHWDRTERAYHLLAEGIGAHFSTIEEALQTAYDKNFTDEYIEPAVLEHFEPIQDRDAVIFFNFREDRMRQLFRVFVDPAFSEFSVKRFSDVLFTTFTAYDEKFSHVPVAFPNEAIEMPLGKTLSLQHKTQLRIAETEKYAHVTYFFNGLKEPPDENEYRVLVPSRSIARHDEHPEMMAEVITDRVLVAINEGGFDFILVNYANADIIAHTGNYDATIRAIQVIDAQIDRILKSVLEGSHVLCITGDHGNAEVILYPSTGETETRHNSSPVPFYLVSNQFRDQGLIPRIGSWPAIGMLSDVAPTILHLMRLSKPSHMTGQSLLDQLLF